jgi:hypothetical protein
VLIDLNDNCAIVIYLISMIGGALGEIPAPGGLFDHMRDPEPFGNWKDP